MKELESVREGISLIDKEIVNLFEKRLDLVVKVANIKKELGSPILHKAREQEVINRITKEIENKQFTEAAEKLFIEIMKISKEVQSKLLFPFNIVIIGFMGTGKTTVGKTLSSLLSMEYVDIDELIELRLNQSIPEIFKLKGEAYFREVEKQVIEDLEDKKSTIISCGGGVVLNKDNIISLKKNGKVVLLNALPETIYSRLKEDSTRPLLKSKSEAEIKEWLEKRRYLYESSADVVINTDNKSIEDICEEIIQGDGSCGSK